MKKVKIKQEDMETNLMINEEKGMVEPKNSKKLGITMVRKSKLNGEKRLQKKSRA